MPKCVTFILTHSKNTELRITTHDHNYNITQHRTLLCDSCWLYYFSIKCCNKSFARPFTRTWIFCIWVVWGICFQHKKYWMENCLICRCESIRRESLHLNQSITQYRCCTYTVAHHYYYYKTLYIYIQRTGRPCSHSHVHVRPCCYLILRLVYLIIIMLLWWIHASKWFADAFKQAHI